MGDENDNQNDSKEESKHTPSKTSKPSSKKKVVKEQNNSLEEEKHYALRNTRQRVKSKKNKEKEGKVESLNQSNSSMRSNPDRTCKNLLKKDEENNYDDLKIISRKELGYVAEIALAKFPDKKRRKDQFGNLLPRRTKVSKGWKDKFIERNKPLDIFIDKKKKEFSGNKTEKEVKEIIMDSFMKDFL